MPRLLFLTLLAAVLAPAQPPFVSLAPTADGKSLYFSTWLRMKGSDQYPSQYKIFVWEEKAGVRLYQQKPPTIQVTGPYFTSTTAYHLMETSVSSDGRTVAVTGLSDCNWGTSCVVAVERYRAEVRVNGVDTIGMPGRPSVSPNGRFVAMGLPTLFADSDQELSVLDLATGARRTAVGRLEFARRHGVADDGTFLTWGSATALHKWDGSEYPLNLPAAAPPQIDAAATRVFYLEGEALWYVDLKTAVRTPVAGPGVGTFDISDDGASAAFVRGGQAWVADSTARRVTGDADTVNEVALSGNGAYLFAATDGGRILRIEVKTGVALEVVPATPYGRVRISVSGPLSPGSVVDFNWTAGAMPPLCSISLFGRDLHQLAATAQSMAVQVDWDFPAGVGYAGMTMLHQGSGAFEGAVVGPVLQVVDRAPRWYVAGNRIAALHEDFSAAVTPERPARAGEVVHLFGSGFGRVEPTPPLGQPAPMAPLARIVEPFACGFEDGVRTSPAEVLFAGLAPGWVGLYQFDVRLPAATLGASANFACWPAVGSTPRSGAFGWLPTQTAP